MTVRALSRRGSIAASAAAPASSYATSDPMVKSCPMRVLGGPADGEASQVDTSDEGDLNSRISPHHHEGRQHDRQSAG